MSEIEHDHNQPDAPKRKPRAKPLPVQVFVVRAPDGETLDVALTREALIPLDGTRTTVGRYVIESSSVERRSTKSSARVHAPGESRPQ